MVRGQMRQICNRLKRIGSAQRPALALLLLTLLTPAAATDNKKHPPDVGHQVPPKVEPSLRIPIEPLGFQQPGTSVSTDRTSILSLNFLDQDHLLFTFRLGGLLKRLPDCPRDDEDQEIRAVDLEIPSGKPVAQADWRMHDFGRYLWPLTDGRVVVRQRDTLLVTGPKLELQPYLHTDSRLREVQVAPDGKILLVEVDRERHGADEHRQLVEEAAREGASPPREDVELAVLRPDTKALLAKSHVRSPVHLALIQDGFVEALAGQKDEWELQFTPFKGEARLFGKVSSACLPNAVVLDDNTLSILTCRDTSGDRRAVAVNLAGDKLWQAPWDTRFVWPTYAYAASGGRFAVGALHLTHSVTSTDPFGAGDVVGERVQVIDAATGRVQLVLAATPVIAAGQNFALSSDGRRFAILREGAVEVYELPPVPVPPAPSQPAGK